MKPPASVSELPSSNLQTTDDHHAVDRVPQPHEEPTSLAISSEGKIDGVPSSFREAPDRDGLDYNRAVEWALFGHLARRSRSDFSRVDERWHSRCNRLFLALTTTYGEQAVDVQHDLGVDLYLADRRINLGATLFTRYVLRIIYSHLQDRRRTLRRKKRIPYSECEVIDTPVVEEALKPAVKRALLGPHVEEEYVARMMAWKLLDALDSRPHAVCRDLLWHYGLIDVTPSPRFAQAMAIGVPEISVRFLARDIHHMSAAEEKRFRRTTCRLLETWGWTPQPAKRKRPKSRA
ncbi:MAG: hypothetical protein WA208_02155 [Thermoanaerobaculia bacterium]